MLKLNFVTIPCRKLLKIIIIIIIIEVVEGYRVISLQAYLVSNVSCAHVVALSEKNK